MSLLVLAILSEGSKQRYLLYVFSFVVLYAALLSLRASYL